MPSTQPQPDDLQEFLDLVFAWDGDEANTFKSVWFTFTGDDKAQHFAGVAAQTKQKLMEQVRFYVRKNRDVYVALGSQITAEDRPGKWAKANKFASNIKAHKTLYVDVDVGKEPEKSYSTVEEAYIAVDQFCADANLPLPNLRVQSGGGLHCYWVMDRPIHKDEWLPLAEALKAALIQHKLKCDAQCTADMSRILRVPTSFNYKTGEPRPVMMYDPGPLFNKATLEAALAPFRGMQTKAPSGPKPSATIHQTQYNKNFSEGVDEKKIQVDMALIADVGCGVFADAIDTGGANHNQTLWNHLILTSTWDPQIRAMAHTISKGYPAYSVAETDAMLERKARERITKDLGWPSCREIHGASAYSAAICQACPHWGKIKAPFDLRKHHAPTPEQKKLHIPDGYWLDEYGFVYTKATDKKGNEWEFRLFDYPIIDGGLVHDVQHQLALDTFVGLRNRRILFPVSQMSNDRDFFKVVYKNNLILSGIQDKYIRGFIMSWTQTLQSITEKRVRPTSLGWDGKSFSYGERAYTGTTSTAAFYAEEEIAEKYQPRGDLSVWQDAVKVVLGHTHLEAIVCSAFASPLVALLGQNGLVMSAFSPDSGVGKTTALKIAQAVWGAPDYMMQLGDTDNSVLKHFGEIKNLPIYYDELRGQDQLDQLSAFVFKVVGGRDKNRLDTALRFKDGKTFKTMMVACSNKSLLEVMARASKDSSAGVNRVFEFQVPVLTNSAYEVTDVMTRIGDLDNNFGRAGEAYARYLAGSYDTVKEMIRVEMKHLEQSLKMATEDRFWLSTMTVMVVAAQLSSHYDIVDFDVDAIRQLMIDTYHSQKLHRSDNVVSVHRTIDLNEILSVFIRENMHKHILVTDRIHRNPGRPPEKAVNVLTPPGMDSRLQNIFGQYGVNDGLLRVDARAFREYLHKQGYSPEVVMNQIKNIPGFDADQKAIAIGTHYKYDVPGKTTCYDIPVPDFDDVTSDPGSSSPT